ncbi:MAG: 50S ribosomal protein L2 [Chlamydiota bacterium]
MKTFRPITPSQRNLVLPTFDELDPLADKKKVKSLLLPKKKTCGRNHHGHITCRHRGGGHKRKLRIVDFLREKENIPAIVAAIDYDPNRSAFLALLHYVDGEKRYILAPQGLKVGDEILTGLNAPFKVGCTMPLKNMPVGAVVHNVELYPGRGGKLVRSGGLSAQLIGRTDGFATLRLPSGEMRMIKEECKATFGAVSNAEHNLRVEGKAGRKRWMGIRPTVRGIAMNPVDHPHGGGEGRGKGNHPQTPWAVSTKGHKTRSKKKTNKWIVKKRG